MSSAIARKRTIVDAVIPGQGVLRDTLLVTGGAALMAVCAQITVPWQPVPFTLQTLALMLCGLSLGAKRGALSQVLYVSAGAVGAPVFAGLAGGVGVLQGHTAGYLLTYPFVAALLGWLAEKGWTQKIWKTAVAMLVADVIVLAVGTAWLATFYGWQKAFMGGTAPFIYPEIMKGIIVMLVLPAAWSVTQRRPRPEE